MWGGGKSTFLVNEAIHLKSLTAVRFCRNSVKRLHNVHEKWTMINCLEGSEYLWPTLSACRKQSILLILPFWSGLDRTHMAGFLPVMLSTKSSLHSCVMSFRNFPNSRDAHFCFTSTFSFWNKTIRLKISLQIWPKEKNKPYYTGCSETIITNYFTLQSKIVIL